MKISILAIFPIFQPASRLFSPTGYLQPEKVTNLLSNFLLTKKWEDVKINPCESVLITFWDSGSYEWNPKHSD
jgi:hypothetical protein